MRKRMLPCLLVLTAALVSGRALALEGTVRFGGSGTDRLRAISSPLLMGNTSERMAAQGSIQ